MTRILRLELRGMRCWEELAFAPDADVHLLVGGNGVGKTSILEALYIATQLRPPSGVRWRSLIPSGQENGFIAATVANRRSEHQVRVGFDRQERRIRVDDQAPRQGRSFARRHPTVLFRPADLALVQGGPKERRRLLDAVGEAVFADYSDLISRYQQALSARNALLTAGAKAGELLDTWSYEAARYGAALMARRAEVSELLSAALEPAYAALCAADEVLKARYRPSAEISIDGLLGLWRGQLGRDRRLGYTAAGPHTEDWELRLDGRAMRQGASQGQQRSACLACRLAQVALIARDGEAPLLLLDDITGELDAQRANRLFELLLKRAGQVFVTATHDVLPFNLSRRNFRRCRVAVGSFQVI